MLANVTSNRNMKWLFLIFSLAFHTLMALLFIRLSANGSRVPGVFGWFFVYWLIISLLSAIAFVARAFNGVKRQSLAYIFLGLGSGLTGVTGLFIGVGEVHRDILWLCLYLGAILLGLTMLSDTFVMNLIDAKE
jgi:hypothetical protein